jgi:hypothetical protein
MAKQPTHVEIGPAWIDVSISEQHSVGAEVTDHPVENGPGITDHIRPTSRTVRIEGLVTNHPLELPLTHVGQSRVDTSPYALNVPANPLPHIPPHSATVLGEPTTYGLGRIPGFGQAAALAGVVTGALGLPIALPRREYAAELHHVDRGARQSVQMTGLRFTEPFDRVRAVYEALCQVVELAEPVQLITGLEVYDSVALADLQFDRSAEHGPQSLSFSATCKVLRLVSSETVKAPAEPRGEDGESRGKQTTEATPTASLSEPAQEQVEQSYGRVLKTEGVSGVVKRVGGVFAGGLGL